MSSMVIKSEEIIVGTEYNSDDVDEELNLPFETTEGEVYSSRVEVVKGSNSLFTVAQYGRGMDVGISDQMVASTKNSATKNILESEKRIRREIANSNERRRMQSINAGFQNLRSLLPKHEGEKLSKAAILQQTSQYICDLENQKTQLLAQNSQLKRTLGQHELTFSGYGSGGGNIEEGCSAIKKRKLTDNVISLQTISDSSDEGLGSVSPEPTTLLQGGNTKGTTSIGLSKTSHGTAHITATVKEVFELKKQLEKERRIRAAIEEELRQIKRQLYSDNYITREVIEHTDNIREDDGTVSYVDFKTDQAEVVVCSSIEEIPDDCTEIVTDDTIQEEIIVTQEPEIKYADTSSLQPILQAAIKAEPKVEVERINDTAMKINADKDMQANQKKGTNSIGLTRSRQNLETIVEAIRHLEGDHLFGDSIGQQKKTQKSQESPLALTSKQGVTTVQPVQQHHQQQQQQRKTIAELSPFLQIKGPKIGNPNIVTIVRGRPVTLKATIEGGTTSASSGVTPSNHSKSIIASGNSSGNNNNLNNSSNSNNSIVTSSNTVIPSGIVKVQTALPSTTPTSVPISVSPSHITITTASLKQCRPGVIVAKQIS